MTYATFSQGFKSGGFNTRAASDGQTQSFRPEEVSNYEVGLKSRYLENSVQLNLSAFYMDYQDIQQQAFFVNDDGDLVSSVVNAAEATVKGLEVEFQVIPIEDFDITAAFGYTDAAFDKFDDVSLGDLSHLKFQDTPEFTYSLGTSYIANMNRDWDVRFNANYTHQSKVYFDRSNAEEIASDGYGVLNVSISAIFNGGQAEVTLYGKNVSDTLYRTSGVNLLDDFGYGLNYYGEPRIVGIKLKLRN